MADQLIDVLHDKTDDLIDLEIDALKEFENDAIDIARFIALGEITKGTGLSSRLTRSLEAANKTTKKGWDAHHIVPQAMRANLKGLAATVARGILSYYDIGLDEAVNGVFLPRSQGDPSGRSGHGSGHSEKNVLALTVDLFNAHKSGLGKAGVIAVLNRYGNEYETGVRK